MTKLKSIHADPIPNGTKFVALPSDGSMAGLFIICDDGILYNQDCDKIIINSSSYLENHDFIYWIELPDSYKLWFEN